MTAGASRTMSETCGMCPEGACHDDACPHALPRLALETACQRAGAAKGVGEVPSQMKPIQAERVASVALSPFRAAEVHRVAVRGGWLYVTTSGTGIATAFVPGGGA